MGLFNFLFGGSSSRLIDPYERWHDRRTYQRNQFPMSKDDALLMYRQLYDGAKSTFNNDDDYPNLYRVSSAYKREVLSILQKVTASELSFRDVQKCTFMFGDALPCKAGKYELYFQRIEYTEGNFGSLRSVFIRELDMSEQDRVMAFRIGNEVSYKSEAVLSIVWGDDVVEFYHNYKSNYALSPLLGLS